MDIASVKRLALAAVAASSLAYAQWPSPAQFALEPSPLEAFTARPAASVAWSSAIGEIEGKYAKATFTALSAAD
jgi:hypothetical protein